MGYITKRKKNITILTSSENDKQSPVYCMTLTNVNELAISSTNDVNLYSFDNITKNFFNITKH